MILISHQSHASISIKNVLLILILLLHVYSCDNPFKKKTSMVFYNDTDIDLGIPVLCDYGWAQKWIKDIPYDTTMVSLTQRKCDGFSQILPNSAEFMRYRFESFEDWFPTTCDFIPFFVIDFSLYSAKRHEIRDYERFYTEFYGGDEYLVRYDLRINDIYSLLNKDGALELHFPPDERMKDIHMWPPYEEVVAQYNK